MIEFTIKKCPDFLDDIINAQLTVALCCQINNDCQEAINYYLEAYDTLGKIMTNTCVTEHNPLISDQAVIIQSMLANLYRTICNYDQGIYHANIALETEEKRLSRNKITMASCFDFIGWCHYMKGEHEKALDFCTKGLHMLPTYTPEFNIQYCNAYHSLGAIWFELGDLKQSSSYCIKAIHIVTSNPDVEDRKVYLAHFISLFERIRQREENASCITKILFNIEGELTEKNLLTKSFFSIRSLYRSSDDSFRIANC